MKTKILSLFALSIFALVFLMSAVSAAVNFINVAGDTQSVAQGNTATVSFDLQESGHGDLTGMSFNVPLTLTSGSNNLVSATTVTGMITTLNQSVTSPTMTLTFTVPSSQVMGTYTGNLTLTGTYSSTVTYDLPLTITVTSNDPQEVLDCQTTGNPGNLEVKRIEFSNNGLQYGSFGEDDEWFPFEEIEVEIEIESDDYDIDDISLEWGIYSLDDAEWLIDIDEESDFNLKDGDEEQVLITFKLDDDLDIDLDEFIDNSENYRFYVIANGVIDDNNAGADDGEDTCDYDYESATIIIESDFVILDNIDMPETLSCGETATITADVWNIGDRDQDEVSIEVYGRESVLEFGKIIEVGDMDAFDRQQISFVFTVPKNIDEKYYNLVFEIRDEDDDVYENDFDEDLAKFTVPFKVEGGCGTSVSEVLISASLESEAKAGQEMIIKATVTNNGDELETFTINAAEFGTWANLISQDLNTLVLNEGQSKDVLFTFDVKKDISGNQMFFIELVSGDDVTRQPVSVNVEKAGSFLGITGLTIGDNASLWGLGILNIILIIVIVIIAVKIARRK